MIHKYIAIGEAIEQVKRGNVVSHHDWQEGKFVFLLYGDVLSDAIAQHYRNGSTPVPVADTLYVREVDGALSPWTPANAELLSELYYVVGH